jgi:phenylacetate-CoA ligase
MPLMQIKSQNNHLECLGYLEKSQWLSRKEIEKIQLKLMKELLKHAYDTVPFYNSRFKRLGLKPEEIKTVEQLSKLPKLTKQEIRSNLDGMVSSSAPRSRLTPFATGGSTGEPLRFFKDNRTIGWSEASTTRSYRWAGLDLGDKYVILWSSPFDLSTARKVTGMVHGRLMRYVMLQSSNMSEQSMAEYVHLIRKFKPRTIKGYASSLLLFANYLKTNRISDLNLHSIISTAENLSQRGRKDLEAQFSCDVFDTYGSREFQMMAGECSEHSGLHISSETVILEFVKDNEAVAPGELGEILVTDLQNFGMPLIRYSIGDAGKPTDEICSCGRGLPLIKSVDGRVTDYIRAGDGRFVPGPAFIYFFSDLPVRKYQIVQKEPYRLIIKIVKESNYSESDDAKIRSRVNHVVGNEITVEIEHVSSIPRSLRSGKFLPVLSELSSFEHQ